MSERERLHRKETSGRERERDNTDRKRAGERQNARDTEDTERKRAGERERDPEKE